MRKIDDRRPSDSWNVNKHNSPIEQCEKATQNSEGGK
jgi:hypothetical protein